MPISQQLLRCQLLLQVLRGGLLLLQCEEVLLRHLLLVQVLLL